jgi:hypothetical protein
MLILKIIFKNKKIINLYFKNNCNYIEKQNFSKIVVENRK